MQRNLSLFSRWNRKIHAASRGILGQHHWGFNWRMNIKFKRNPIHLRCAMKCSFYLLFAATISFLQLLSPLRCRSITLKAIFILNLAQALSDIRKSFYSGYIRHHLSHFLHLSLLCKSASREHQLCLRISIHASTHIYSCCQMVFIVFLA